METGVSVGLEELQFLHLQKAKFFTTCTADQGNG